ncbi:MAG: polysaccharide deacetylase family protein [Bacteroidia bacterium]
MFSYTIPVWVQSLFPSVTWKVKTTRPVVYLTFDDGPHPEITPWVLEQLQTYNAKATFFCVGDNVHKFPQTYRQVLEAGHRTGNHTYHHLKGWKTPVDIYLEDIRLCSEKVDSDLFRPPYGKITPAQINQLKSRFQVVMWDIMTFDFDVSIIPAKALSIILPRIRAGSVIVFHDSEKAERNMKVMLPQLLEFCKQKGYTFETL